jgi:hypothetical protein
MVFRFLTFNILYFCKALKFQPPGKGKQGRERIFKIFSETKTTTEYVTRGFLYLTEAVRH